MKKVLEGIINKAGKQRMLAVLIDPDKMNLNNLSQFMDKVNRSKATHVFVGGSTVANNLTQVLVCAMRQLTHLPIVLFPGGVAQIANKADAILFLSLLSGRNPEYLIGKHVESVSKLRSTPLEVIPTGYILIESGKQTAVQKVTSTQPLSRTNNQLVTDTAKAGEFLGLKLIYLEAGSGAKQPVPLQMITKVKADLKIPLIVGGGIRSEQQLEEAYNAGADLVVIGTAFEEDEAFFEEIKD